MPGSESARDRLTAVVRRYVELAKLQGRPCIQMPIADAEELCQVLDSLRTADQIDPSQADNGNCVVRRDREAYDNYPPCPPEY